MPAKKFERIETDNKALLGMSTEELLLGGEKDELFRRAWNKLVERKSKES